jgi:ribonuclease HII
MSKWVIGVDEAGRGPLAGPVAVGVVLIPPFFDWAMLPGVGDSKKISEAKREQIYTATMRLVAAGKMSCTVEMMGAAAIDQKGIAVVIRTLVAKGIAALLAEADLEPEKVRVLLDGSLTAPAKFIDQQTIIRGDGQELVIGLASIMAKVTRDRYMVERAKKPMYRSYHFEQHKGYGTAAHRRAVAHYGLSPEHRRTFCKNISYRVTDSIE